MWFMVDCQFWPRVGYGICNNTAPWKVLDGCLQRIYWQILGRGGVRRSAPTALRQLDRGFYGIGYPHPGVECLLQQVTKLLIHYGCKSGLGIELQVSMELLITELGISLQPLQESFEIWGSHVTDTWIKTVWEKVSKFNITIEIMPLPFQPPRAGDKWFMQAIKDSGITDKTELAVINRARCHQQVLFLSDILDAGGKCVDKRYLNFQREDEIWSTAIFPLEKPPNRHLATWRAAL
jgi:hypothetical protein